jgi:two-component system, sensor histidine kinase RpfC
VLVADDNATNRKIAQVALENAGHVCTLVDNGDEALFALNDDAYDVAILDMHMPKRHGIEVAKIYQFAGFANPTPTPIILLTADTTLETREEAASAGITKFLTKPILPSEIVRVVEEVGTQPVNADIVTRKSLDARGAAEPTDSTNLKQEISRVEDLPILDAPAISELVSLMEKSEQQQFFREFSDDVSQYVTTLRNARMPADCAAVHDAMHALAGAAGIVGAVRLSRLAKRIERYEQGTLASRAVELAAELEAIANETHQAITNL